MPRMPSKCRFCGEDYRDCEDHFCIEHIIKLGEEAEKQLSDFTKTIVEQSDAALEALKNMNKLSR